MNTKRPNITFGQNNEQAQVFGSEGGGSSNGEGEMQMDNGSEASGMMQMADDDDVSEMDQQ